MILIRLEFGDRFVMLLICSGFWFRYGLGNYLDMVLIWFGNRAPYFRVPDRLASSKETETASGSCSFFFSTPFWCLRVNSAGHVALDGLRCPEGQAAGSRGGRQTEDISQIKGGASSASAVAGRSHSPPRAVVETACWAATLSKPHHRRRQPAAALERTAGGARGARTWTRSRLRVSQSQCHRQPISEARTRRLCGPGSKSSGSGGESQNGLSQNILSQNGFL